MRDLIEYLGARAVADSEWRAVVMAHPCSGTTWLVDTLNHLGIPALHELVRPADPPWRVLVTYRAFGWPQPADEERIHLVRDPLRVVRSTAALFGKRPRVARDIYAQIVGTGTTATVPPLGELGPVSLAAWTLAVFNQRAEARGLSRFRIEDVAPGWAPPSARRNPHAGATPLEWDDIKMCRDLLWTQWRQYGYPAEQGE